MFVYLGFFVPLEFFTHMDYRDVTLAMKSCKFWSMLGIYSWPLSSEGSLACHVFCDTGHPFIMVISEVPWQSHQAFSNAAVTTCFYDLGLSQLTQRHSACEDNALTHCTTALVKGAMNTLSFHHLCKPWLMVAFFYFSCKKKVGLLFEKKITAMIGRNLQENQTLIHLNQK